MAYQLFLDLLEILPLCIKFYCVPSYEEMSVET